MAGLLLELTRAPSVEDPLADAWPEVLSTIRRAEKGAVIPSEDLAALRRRLLGCVRVQVSATDRIRAIGEYSRLSGFGGQVELARDLRQMAHEDLVRHVSDMLRVLEQLGYRVGVEREAERADVGPAPPQERSDVPGVSPGSFVEVNGDPPPEFPRDARMPPGAPGETLTTGGVFSPEASE